MTWEVCKTTQKDGEITNSVFLGLPCLSQAMKHNVHSSVYIKVNDTIAILLSLFFEREFHQSKRLVSVFVFFMVWKSLKYLES